MMWGKLLSRIKSMYNTVCVRIKEGDRGRFGIDSIVRQGCIMSLWLFNVYMDGLMKEIKRGMGRRGESGYCCPLVCRSLGSMW